MSSSSKSVPLCGQPGSSKEAARNHLQARFFGDWCVSPWEDLPLNIGLEHAS